MAKTLPNPWLAIHPSLTRQIRLPDPESGFLVTFGFWPPLKDAELRALVRSVSIFGPPPSTPLSAEAQAEQNKTDYAVLAEVIRWAVRDWDIDPRPTFDEIEFDGRKHRRLSDDSLDLLRVNDLFVAVGSQAVLMNMLDPSGKGGSGFSQGSGSQSLGTPASGATPDSKEATSPGEKTPSHAGGTTAPAT